MNPSRDPGFDPRIAGWLEDKPATAPADVVETVLAAIPYVSQRRVAKGFPWRYLRMTSPIRLAAGLVTALALAFGSFIVLNGPHGSNVGVSAPPSASPSPTQNGPLDGTSWTTQIALADTPSGVPEIAIGTWTLKFAPAVGYGTMLFLGNPRGGGPGYLIAYRANSEIELPAEPSCARDEGKPAPTTSSTYRYTIAQDTLTFTLVTTDSCTARVVNLTAHPWKKAP